jgi:hypothetical protein
MLSTAPEAVSARVRNRGQGPKVLHYGGGGAPKWPCLQSSARSPRSSVYHRSAQANVIGTAGGAFATRRHQEVRRRPPGVEAGAEGALVEEWNLRRGPDQKSGFGGSAFGNVYADARGSPEGMEEVGRMEIARAPRPRGREAALLSSSDDPRDAAALARARGNQ